MNRCSLCFVAVLMLALGLAAQTAAEGRTSSQPQMGATAQLPSLPPVQSWPVIPWRMENFGMAPQSHEICYRIRAYIFRRDDDHAPQLAGSTTCGPRQPQAKNVHWPKARLVPAD